MSPLRRHVSFGAVLLLLLVSVICPSIALGDDDDQDPYVSDLEDEEDLASMQSEAIGSPPTPPSSPSSSPSPSVACETLAFEPPSTQGLLWAETFDSDYKSRWVNSADKIYTGPWYHTERTLRAIKGDYGLKIGAEAQHHGIASRIPRMESNKDQHFIIQYEAKFENDLHCGGAYLKLFDLQAKDLSTFNGNTDYVIMFGPDRCGTTNKVHFILKRQNPNTKEWSEHHFKSAPSVPHDKGSHLYGLWIKPDNSFDIMIDNVAVRSGGLLADMDPPVTPPEIIDDPTDKRPADWVMQKTIPDPLAKKPVDWDESEPRTIPDPDGKMPEGWLEHEPKTIPDLMSKKPEDWDEEEDGVWKPDTIDNPRCDSVPGCGKWIPPMKPNPKYKGKWAAPQIDNPEYKGEWKPKQIPNPAYYKDTDPHAMSPIDSIGFELWTMQSGILFDNIVLSRNIEAAKDFGERTWAKRSNIEKCMSKATQGEEGKLSSSDDDTPISERVMIMVKHLVENNPIAVCGASIVFLILVFLMSRRSGSKRKVARKESDTEDSGDEVGEDGAKQKKNEESKPDEEPKTSQRSEKEPAARQRKKPANS